MYNKKNKYIVISIFVGIVFLVIAATIGIKVYNKSVYPVTQIQTTKINTKSKKVSNYEVLSNGKTRSISSFKTSKKAEKIEVDPEVFSTYTKNNTTYLKVVKKSQLRNQSNQKVSDPNYWKLIYAVAKDVHSNLYKLTLFKTKKHYYAFFQINQWILDTGTLYSFLPTSNTLTKLCTLDNQNVINISN